MTSFQPSPGRSLDCLLQELKIEFKISEKVKKLILIFLFCLCKNLLQCCPEYFELIARVFKIKINNNLFFSLHFDKLFVDNEIYMFNEATGQVSLTNIFIQFFNTLILHGWVQEFLGVCTSLCQSFNNGGIPHVKKAKAKKNPQRLLKMWKKIKCFHK